MISINHKDTKATKMMRVFEPLPPETERLANQTVDAAMKVHRALGPGLMESVYEKCLMRELSIRHIPVQEQVIVPITYEGLRLESGLRLDLLVDNQLIVEIKAVEEMHRLFKALFETHKSKIGVAHQFQRSTAPTGH